MECDEAWWAKLEGGYRLPYDPRPALAAVEAGDAEAWHELWEELHHQGDVGVASYAAVPIIAAIIERAPKPDWNGYGLVATIEEVRTEAKNPPVPDELKADYHAAWQSILASAIRDFPNADEDNLISSLLSVLAHSKSRRLLGMFAMWSEEECAEALRALQEWPPSQS